MSWQKGAYFDEVRVVFTRGEFLDCKPNCYGELIFQLLRNSLTFRLQSTGRFWFYMSLQSKPLDPQITKGDESDSIFDTMVFERCTRLRSPRQRYLWPEKALSIVHSTRIPKKDGAFVVKQLREITAYPEKACWRLAERYGFRRPNSRRCWSQEDIARIIEMTDTVSVREIAKRFNTTMRTIYLKIYQHNKTAGHGGMIYTVSAISNLLKVSPSTVRQWGWRAD